MKKSILLFTTVSAIFAYPAALAQISLETAPPVVIKTVPTAGSTEVDPALTEIKVTFSKKMQDGSWSWSTWGSETFPEMDGQPKYLEDGRTCVLPVKLQPGKFYATWLNSEKFRNFKDQNGTPAVPYLLTFRTTGTPVSDPKVKTVTGIMSDPQLGSASGSEDAQMKSPPNLNEEQRLVFDWTHRQFRSFFDGRTFAGWSDQDKSSLESKSIDALKGPRTPEYYQAINTLAALRSTKALDPLRALAFDRREKDNRDRWMAVRTLAILGDKASVPELIHLVYHGNINTRWWAQIALVQLTGQNFGSDWQAWGKWWNDSASEPKFSSELITWYKDQGDAEKMKSTQAEHDAKFLGDLRTRMQK